MTNVLKRSARRRRTDITGHIALMMALIVAISACAGNDGNEATDADDGGVDAVGGTEKTENDSEPDTATASGDPIAIGAFYDLTGPLAVTGEEGRKGAELAVDVINRGGGVLDRPLELRVTDGQCDAATGLAAVRRLIDEEDLFAVVGGSCSSVALPIKDLMDEEGIPYISGSAAASEIAEPPSDYVFMGTMPTGLEAEATANLIVDDLDPESMAVVALANDYGRSALQAVEAVLESRDRSDLLTEVIEVPIESTDYRPQMLVLDEADAEVTLVAVTDITAVLSQAEEVGVDTQWITFAAGTIRPTIQPLSEQGLLEGLTTTYYGPELIATDAEAEGMRTFVQEFQDAHGEFPSSMEMIGWNTIHLIKAGLEEAGTVDREALIDGLESKTFDFGTSFPYDFSGGNRAGLTDMSLLTYGDSAPGENGLYGDAVIQ